jgi:RHS repeat-associated protein
MQKDTGEGLTLRCLMASCVGRANNSNTKTSRTCVMKHIANSSCQSSIAIICEPVAQGNAQINTDLGEFEQASFTYNANFQRAKMVVTQDDFIVKKKYYAGDYEEINVENMDLTGMESGMATEVCYIRTPQGLQAAYKFNQANRSEGIYYFGRDHAGSITSVISQEGEVLQRYIYDAWGKRQIVNDTSANGKLYYPHATQPSIMFSALYEPLFDRGYIGEEHLDLFGLINLNARLYDPVLGRFLSPDPYIQAPDNLQNFNRYSYGWNNPLRYSDPTGLLISFDVELPTKTGHKVKPNIKWIYNQNLYAKKINPHSCHEKN